jgi:hypothetical protein
LPTPVSVPVTKNTGRRMCRESNHECSQVRHNFYRPVPEVEAGLTGFRCLPRLALPLIREFRRWNVPRQFSTHERYL